MNALPRPPPALCCQPRFYPRTPEDTQPPPKKGGSRRRSKDAAFGSQRGEREDDSGAAAALIKPSRRAGSTGGGGGGRETKRQRNTHNTHARSNWGNIDIKCTCSPKEKPNPDEILVLQHCKRKKKKNLLAGEEVNLANLVGG